MKKGYYPNMSILDYHNDLESMSKTGLVMVASAPKKYEDQYIKGNRDEDVTGPMIIGNAFHCLTLEPDRFYDEYVIAPDCNLTTKEGKRIWSEFCMGRFGVEFDKKTTHVEAMKKFKIGIISETDYELIQNMAAAVHDDPTAAWLLNKQKMVEETFCWEDQQTGVLVKVRPDGRIPSERIMFDLKSTVDASKEKFPKQIGDKKYYFQAAMMLDGVNQFVRDGLMPEPHDDLYNKVIFIAVEKTPPYLVACYDVSERGIDQGRYEYKQALALYKRCRDRGVWPGYSSRIETVDIPSWNLPPDLSVYFD